jgi:2,4-dienoyl-CoA reductase-like NADH-dependent reductase (Old Yellow Enzyme family)
MDAGIWSDKHTDAWARITAFIKKQGAVPAIQIAHAGRKASTPAPWLDGEKVEPKDGGWTPIAPTSTPFSEAYPVPEAMTKADIARVRRQFADAAARSRDAGFELLEIHGAHGYLMHEFLSPLSNTRTDEYGGGFENRTRFAVETVDAVRAVWPERLPLIIRFSCTDWADGGWNVEETAHLARILKDHGVDMVDCSSGAIVPNVRIPVGSGFQVPLSEHVRREARILTAAVGMITAPEQADQIIRTGQADMVFLARELLRDPYWPLHAAKTLRATDRMVPPKQYARAF